jgi:SAM-dependent methyltransferase
MSTMTATDFEARYRQDPDPWRYTTSTYERDKYAATLEAVGPGPFSQALELGASIGVFTALLAPRCRSLVTIDFAPTAVQRARERLAATPHVDILRGEIPDAIPPLRYDLVVASEILYYLEPATLSHTLEVLSEVLAPGGRVVAVHWRRPGPERPLTAAQAHEALKGQSWLRSSRSDGTADYLLHVLERR